MPYKTLYHFEKDETAMMARVGSFPQTVRTPDTYEESLSLLRNERTHANGSQPTALVSRLDRDDVGAELQAPTRHRYTQRESQILQLIASGRTDKEVAAALRISLKTVGTHLGRLYRRSGVRSRTEAVVCWLAFGQGSMSHSALEPRGRTEQRRRPHEAVAASGESTRSR